MRGIFSAGMIGTALAIVSSSAAWGQARTIENAPANYRHAGTGTAYPVQIGDFYRTKVVEYDADGGDSSASYDLVRGNEKLMSISFYIYPMEPSSTAAERSRMCAKDFIEVKQAIDNAYPGARLVTEDTPGTPSPGVSAEGKHSRHTFNGNFAGTQMPVKSETYLYCATGGKWVVKYRATWPATMELQGDLYKFMAGLPWGDKLSR